MKILTKDQALDAIACISTDFAMLASGDWVPDDDSCTASIEVLEALREYILLEKTDA